MKKCGFIVVLGPPNVGKSSLVNALVGESVSIVSPKAQTTRNSICGVTTRDETQMIFIDTPGMHDSEKDFNILLNKVAAGASDGADLCYYLRSFDTRENERLVRLKNSMHESGVPVFVIHTKQDVRKIEQGEEKNIYYISSKTNEGIEKLLHDSMALMPEGDWHFEEDHYTNSTVRFMSQESIRLALFENLNQELPYATAVEIEEFNEEKTPTLIRASIIVERDSQKGIVIGEKGSMIKKIGTKARGDIENLLQKKVFLELQVKVIKNWTKNKDLLKRLGILVDKK